MNQFSLDNTFGIRTHFYIKKIFYINCSIDAYSNLDKKQ